jgi:hypothetical protein
MLVTMELNLDCQNFPKRIAGSEEFFLLHMHPRQPIQRSGNFFMHIPEHFALDGQHFLDGGNRFDKIALCAQPLSFFRQLIPFFELLLLFGRQRGRLWRLSSLRPSLENDSKAKNGHAKKYAPADSGTYAPRHSWAPR